MREAPGSSGSTTPARSASQSGSSSDEDIRIPYQETGTSSLEEEMMEVARKRRKLSWLRSKRQRTDLESDPSLSEEEQHEEGDDYQNEGPQPQQVRAFIARCAFYIMVYF